MLHGFEQCILADTLRAAEHERVVEFVLGKLYAMRQPVDDVVNIIGKDFLDMVAPNIGLGCVAELDHRCAVEIEYCAAGMVDEAAFANQPIADQHPLAWRPS